MEPPLGALGTPPEGGPKPPKSGIWGCVCATHTKRPLLKCVRFPLGKFKLSDSNRVQNTVFALCVQNVTLRPLYSILIYWVLDPSGGLRGSKTPKTSLFDPFWGFYGVEWVFRVLRTPKTPPSGEGSGEASPESQKVLKK